MKQRTFKKSTRKESETQTEQPHAREYNTTFKRFSLARNFQIADLITFLNAICGLSCLLCVLEWTLSNQPYPKPSHLVRAMFSLPFLGLVFDIADGRVARYMSTGPSMLGQELDSFSDLISFGIAPATLAWTIGLRTLADKFCLVFFVAAGIARLARFNVTQQYSNIKGNGKQTFFEGMPIPSSLFIVVIMWYWVESGILRNGIPGGSFQVSLPFVKSIFSKRVHDTFHVHFWSLLFVFWGCGMVSRTLRIPKL